MNKPTELLWCIQCTDLTSNTIGDFVYHKQAPFRAVSPVFTELQELFLWMKQQGYSTGQLADMNVYTSYTKEEVDQFGKEHHA